MNSIPQQRAAAVARAGNLESWLEALSRDELLALVREQLTGDRELRRRLELRAAAARSDIAVIRDRIASLLDTRPFARYGYIEYADARGYGEQAAEAVTALRTLTADGRAAEAAALAREAIRAIGQAYGEIDDSSGYVGSVAADLAEVHMGACREARPDPAETAEWLVGHLLDDLNDATDIDLLDYCEVLGEAGLARVRQLATEAWRRRPSGWAEKYLMERLAKAEGNVDALIAVRASDLSPTGSTHLQIAQELEAAGRGSEALEWAERGLREAMGHTGADSRLVDISVPGTRRQVACPRQSRSAGTTSMLTARSPRTGRCARSPVRPGAGMRNASPRWSGCVPTPRSGAAAGTAGLC
ncbi:DUF6880 family protein [Streptomyces sp. A3M-1-3]|uniref:DUF6880 family protein n=1 Tax=Streptomyces sp. A3M-1-3 TaxID=2962044 RepID=UPI0027E3E084|nr:DUF6880 family protein [Streptomyces sp. A3M-1-3]